MAAPPLEEVRVGLVRDQRILIQIRQEVLMCAAFETWTTPASAHCSTPQLTVPQLTVSTVSLTLCRSHYASLSLTLFLAFLDTPLCDLLGALTPFVGLHLARSIGHTPAGAVAVLEHVAAGLVSTRISDTTTKPQHTNS